MKALKVVRDVRHMLCSPLVLRLPTSSWSVQYRPYRLNNQSKQASSCTGDQPPKTKRQSAQQGSRTCAASSFLKVVAMDSESKT